MWYPFSKSNIDKLALYREILGEVKGLDAEWDQRFNGMIRSEEDRCPLQELWFQRTGDNRMPTAEELGLGEEQRMAFMRSADDTLGRSRQLRKAICQATKTLAAA